jgi:hypothetical protein
MKNRRFRRYLEFLRPVVTAPFLPCFYGCGCSLPAGDDDASTATRRAHLEACPVALAKSTLKERVNTLIAQNPAHSAALSRPQGA